MESRAGSSSNPQTAWSEIMGSEISDHLGRADIGQGLDQDNSVAWSDKDGSEVLLQNTTKHHHLALQICFFVEWIRPSTSMLVDRQSLG